MWLASLAWRALVGADGILEERLMSPQQEERLRQLYPHGLHGVDVMVGVRLIAPSLPLHGPPLLRFCTYNYLCLTWPDLPVAIPQGHPILFYLIGATDVPTLKAEYPEALLRRYHVQV